MILPSPPKEGVVEGEVEFETYVSKEDIVKFLRNLADQIEKESVLEIRTEDWTIRHEFGEPIEVEVEYDGNKLEIELEFRKWRGLKS